MEVPSLLRSKVGSKRASTAVLSQIAPAPGAVIAAQAEPEDCCGLPGPADLSASSSDRVVGSRATDMSAPTRVSQNGETVCLTETSEEPFGLSLDDQFIESPALSTAACGLGARRWTSV